MNQAESLVKALMKASTHKPRLKKSERVIFPTQDCPLPDFDDDLTDNGWLMLCHLVHSPELRKLTQVQT